MPWLASDAPAHDHAANTPELQHLWAQVANHVLEETGGDDAIAVREANAAVKRKRNHLVNENRPGASGALRAGSCSCPAKG